MRQESLNNIACTKLSCSLCFKCIKNQNVHVKLYNVSPFVFLASYNYDQNPRRRQSRQQTTDDDSGDNASSGKQTVISLYTNHEWIDHFTSNLFSIIKWPKGCSTWQNLEM